MRVRACARQLLGMRPGAGRGVLAGQCEGHKQAGSKAAEAAAIAGQPRPEMPMGLVANSNFLDNDIDGDTVDRRGAPWDTIAFRLEVVKH